jgi:aspartyl-tRNA(Asn)/glutamyl-tRNA(Gln) amidotransferase subunit B
LEIVTEPDFRSGQEVSDFLAELRKTVQYLGISDGNMEEGSFRCDCNVSVRKKGVQTLGERNEIKNINSRRFAKNAIDYEAKRQIAIIENGGIIQKTTLLFDPVLNETRPMRKKESENDYRYFPEPDLPPVLIDEIFLKEIEQKLVALPIDRYYKLVNEYKLSSADAIFLTEEKAWTELYFLLVSHSAQYKLIAELLVQKILPYLNLIKKGISIFNDPLLLLRFVELLQNGKIAKSAVYQHVFPVWIEDIRQNPEDIAQNLELFQSDNQDFLDAIIAQVIIANQDKVTAYKKGKTGLLGFFMGQVMQISGGKADPNTLKGKIEAALEK